MTREPADRPDRTAEVSLREITAETVVAICDLAVAPQQDNYVAPNALSIAQAHYSSHAWFRAIYADVTPVGFAMLYQDADEAKYYLWRFMIDARYQGFGFGRRALEQVIGYVRAQPGATEMTLTFVPGEYAPVTFYRRLGFVETGVEEDGELEMKLTFGKTNRN